MLAWVTKRVSILAVIGLSLSFSPTARAADDVPNPQYNAWEKFKPGSSATLAADAKAGPNAIDVHIETTSTLVSVTPEEITIDFSSKVTAMGHTNNPTVTKRTIKAKAPAKDVKEAGTKDIEAAGKTYTCKVLELTGDTAAVNNAKPTTGKAAASSKATIYVNPDVPGGLVNIELPASGDKTTTFILKTVEVK